jgi:hypothetical protein
VTAWRRSAFDEVRTIGEATLGALPLDQVGSVLDVSLKALALAGLVVYAIVRLAIDGFYKTFDVSAEEVGLTQSTIIGRAAVYLFVVIGAIGAATILAMLFGPRSGRTLADSWAYVFLVILLLWVIWFARWLINDRAFLNFAVYTVAVVCICIGIFFAMVGLAGVTHGRPWLPGEQEATGVAVVLLVFGLAASTWLEGRSMALGVLTGREAAGRILNLRAIEVFVTLTDGEDAAWLDTSRSYLFLGEGDRWLVLFDPQRTLTIRIPTGKAALAGTHLHFAPPLYTILFQRLRVRLEKLTRASRGHDG